MSKRVRAAFLLLLATELAGCAGPAASPTPLPRAHAHNDYEHARPLFDALERGFCGVEADVYLVDGRLLVAHDRKDVKPERTLEALYLDPLRARVQANGGRVFRHGPPLTLLVDVKSEAEATYAAIQRALQPYTAILTVFRGERIEPGAVTIIISGNRARETMAAQPVRHAALDGRKADLDANPPASLVPLVSDNWNNHFVSRWAGPLSAADHETLRQWVERAHAQGRRLRFWNTPDRPEVWQTLVEAGVDVIGTDDLAGLERFFAARK
ncbi:MAG TPA: phosphatidylinositol-specific phospholipase C/glycerophosphodiester phosphodiesterase family protein [Opitutaceae bacterium]|nr:phosphatidylinositol-specific phospholipase C/glycerophosphodiester phosphodiesterase family protein [Opitutaceae bacterium]